MLFKLTTKRFGSIKGVKYVVCKNHKYALQCLGTTSVKNKKENLKESVKKTMESKNVPILLVKGNHIDCIRRVSRESITYERCIGNIWVNFTLENLLAFFNTNETICAYYYKRCDRPKNSKKKKRKNLIKRKNL